MRGTTGAQGFNLGGAELAKALAGSTQASEKFVDAAQKSAQALFTMRVSEDAGPAKPRSDLITPRLTEPTAKAREELNGSGKLALLLGQLIELLGDVSQSQLESRLATWRAMMEVQKAMGEQLSQELQTALGEAERATEAYQSALGNLNGARDALDAAKQKLAQAQAKLVGMSTDDSGYAKALVERNQAQGEVNQAQQAVDLAEAESIQAHEQAVDKAQNADKLLSQVQGLGFKNETVQKGELDNLSNTAKLTKMMAMFMELVSKNSEESLKSDLATFQALQEGRQKEMEKKSAEYKEEVRKAEELNRIMGCIGKILGALLTVVSVVAAAFTGGASLALAAVGVALMVVDEIVKATTGVSFIQEALKPLMEHVLKPLMELIGKAITKALEAAGVDKKAAELVGSIVGAVLAAVAMVAVMVVVAVVGKGAAAKLGGALSKLLGDAIKKIVPSVLKEVAKGGSKLLSQGAQRLINALGNAGSKIGLRSDALGKEMMANTLNKVAIGSQAAQTATQMGGNVAQGVFMKNALEVMADFNLARAAMDQIEKWLKEAVESYTDKQKLIRELHTALSIALQEDAVAGRFVLRHTHA
ncbi:type III secretion system translocon subunit SctE [Burkholderia ubonensis]|uniref:Translocator protein BipB n=1 Tax=Burkholderia ubonensis TaxID=101571 RepID=A0A119IW73_9BURK|nr:type III secretion system translocon subunit SctE [Burkholderia ubonensis]KVZ51089.1 pathogenicity island 1 effector protein SipB [Burkholderia ubonensis]KWA80404.1 pathogenicity island 1 effector protein SipB [Burkholderia ubonensis]KWB95247.1 pathogenicity island 1 effector protein SipB [Burkholderia ubonensis]KWZ58538.1 pathogenicity island 1 effector protein SipB [Burkholderia ubonensis]